VKKGVDMKFNKKISNKKLKPLGILVIFLIIPLILSTPLFKFNTDLQENEENQDNNEFLTLKSSGPVNETYFKYYKVITIDSTKVVGSGSHKDFPMLISLFDSDLRNDVQSTGNDIAFSNGTDWLDHEIEVFNQTYNSTHARLVAWVRIPWLSTSTDTIIDMYYGNSTMSSQQNPEGVWNSDYEAVWHMNQDPSGGAPQILDSTSNNNDLTTSGFLSDQRVYDQKLGSAIWFDGSDDYLGISPFSGPTTGFTFETWFKFDNQYTIGSDLMHLFSGNSATYNNPRVRFRSTDGVAVGSVATTSPDDNDSCYGTKSVWAADTWFHYAFRFSIPIKTTTLYLDGTQDGSKVDSDLGYDHVGWSRLSIGSDNGADVWGSGTISEFRVVKVPLSQDWIVTEYNNQNDPDSFYSLSSAKIVPSLNDFQFYKEITIYASEVEGSGVHKNFPVLISLLDQDLHDIVQSDGDDIAFHNGVVWLDHEIEEFNQSYSSDYAKLVAWVRIPSLSTSEDTVIRMYYGNSTMEAQEYPKRVWDSNYLGVWHLKEDPSDSLPQMLDSTSNNRDCTSYGGMTTGDQVKGKIDGSLYFDGSNDYIQWSSAITQTTGTYSWWVYAHSVTGERNYIADDAYRRRISLWDDVVKIETDTDAEYFDFTLSSISINAWTHIVFSRAGDIGDLYINGSWVQQVTVTGADNLTVSCIGGTSDNTRMVDGVIDEVRISDIVRSSGWIATEHNNQENPHSFYSVSRAYRQDYPSVEHFEYFKDITIHEEKVEGDLTDFPMLVSILDSDLKTAVQSDGDDIAFWNGTNWLDYEIEVFNQSYDPTNAQLIAWVRIPSLSATTDTVIKMYYGNSTLDAQENPTGVWSENYKGIYHFKEDPSEAILDSSKNWNYGTSEGSMASNDQVSAKINGGFEFDGNNDHIAVLDPIDTEAMTFSAWVFLTDTSDDWITLAQRTDAAGTSYDWQMYARASDAPTQYHSVFRIGSGAESDITLSSIQWYYLVGQHNGTDNLFYLNGNLVDISPEGSTVTDSNNNVWIGGNSVWGTEYLNGIIDEVRFSNTARSSDWILTEYNNQNDPDSFYTVGDIGSEQAVADIQVNAIDYYNNPIPYVNVSISNKTIQFIKSNLTGLDGSTIFSNINQSTYNFTATMKSNIDDSLIITINRTINVKINSTFHNITLVCNASQNIFYVSHLTQGGLLWVISLTLFKIIQSTMERQLSDGLIPLDIIIQ
jgi:hypothetical protein